MASIGQTGRSMKMAFAKFGTNSWGVAAAATQGVYFESDGGQQYNRALIQDESFNQSFQGAGDPGLVEAPAVTYSGKLRYDDWQYVLEACAMGSPAAATISDSTSGQTTSWQHVIDLADDIDGLGITTAIDKVQYVEELTSAKVHGFSVTQQDNGSMMIEFSVTGTKLAKDTATNTNSVVADASFLALGNRVVQQQGQFRINTASAGALGASDALNPQPESITLTFDRPQDAPHVYNQDYITEPADQGYPTTTLEITWPRMNTPTANSIFGGGLQSATSYKADWTFNGAFINSTDQYQLKYEFPNLQFEPDGFLATAEGANQVKPSWRLRATLAATSPTGMAVVRPFRLTRLNSQSITAFDV